MGLARGVFSKSFHILLQKSNQFFESPYIFKLSRSERSNFPEYLWEKFRESFLAYQSLLSPQIKRN